MCCIHMSLYAHSFLTVALFPSKQLKSNVIDMLSMTV